MSAVELPPQLLEQLVGLLAEQLAPRIAEELAARIDVGRTGAVARPRLTLEEFVAELTERFPAKSEKTWRSWVYARTCRRAPGAPAGTCVIPGAVKLGTWFFDPEEAFAWIEAGAP